MKNKEDVTNHLAKCQQVNTNSEPNAWSKGINPRHIAVIAIGRAASAAPRYHLKEDSPRVNKNEKKYRRCSIYFFSCRDLFLFSSC